MSLLVYKHANGMFMNNQWHQKCVMNPGICFPR